MGWKAENQILDIVPARVEQIGAKVPCRFLRSSQGPQDCGQGSAQIGPLFH